MNDQEMRDYHYALYETHDLKVKVLHLNREIVSCKSESEKLKDEIALMEKDGTLSEAQQIRDLLQMLEDKYPGERVTEQRKQIASLHKKIKLLEGKYLDALGSLGALWDRSVFLHELAQEVRDEFPFRGEVVSEIARFIERH